MIRYFCDSCAIEVKNPNDLKPIDTGVIYTVYQACKERIIQAIKDGPLSKEKTK